MALTRITPPTTSGAGWEATRAGQLVVLTLRRWQPENPITLPAMFRPTSETRAAVSQESAGACRIIVGTDGVVNLYGHDERVTPVRINGQAVLV